MYYSIVVARQETLDGDRTIDVRFENLRGCEDKSDSDTRVFGQAVLFSLHYFLYNIFRRVSKSRTVSCRPDGGQRRICSKENDSAIENTLSWRRYAMLRPAMGALYYTLHYADLYYGVHVRMPSADGT